MHCYRLSCTSLFTSSCWDVPSYFLLFELFMNIQIITEDFLLHVIISLSLHIYIYIYVANRHSTVKNIFLLNLFSSRLMVHSREQNQQNLTTRSPTSILVKIRSYSWSTLCISRIRTEFPAILTFIQGCSLFVICIYRRNYYYLEHTSVCEMTFGWLSAERVCLKTQSVKWRQGVNGCPT